MRTLEWNRGSLKIIDQRRLPTELVMVELSDYRQVAKAIKEMWVRGAPAIGAAAAYGMAVAGLKSQAQTEEALLEDLAQAAEALRDTRPTAANLFWAIERMLQKAHSSRAYGLPAMREALVAEAQEIADEDVERNKAMGRYGAELIRDGDTILTHCNAGALATVDYGTALAPIRVAHSQGKTVHVLVDETRPRLQGARLTAWELMQQGIPMTLIVDGAAGHFLRSRRVNLVLVGADRVAANGDVANKIGTYGLAVLAQENGIPFYVVAPSTTIDLSTPSGDLIPIEEREPREVTHIAQTAIAPAGVKVANPAFDITPHHYLSGIITEWGIVRPPFTEGLAQASGGRREGLP